jgi:predicted regulator of Ras-like GTPase activity (Roadblock/LC7/MglB family)
MTLARQDDLGWFLDDFVVRVADVAHTVVVSADGILLARSSTLPPANADQLAAVASGLASLSEAAARTFDAGGVVQTCVEMEGGYLFMMTMGLGSSLAVLAAPECEMGLLAYEMSSLVDQVGERLTPELRAARGLASRAGGNS